MTEKLAEEMKKAGHSDILIMSAGPYKHNSCMSAYCVDAQKMADAVGMECWKNDDMNRFFSQILFFDQVAVNGVNSDQDSLQHCFSD